MENLNQPWNKYRNGKIYKIVDIGYNRCYIGSTVQELCNRMADHRSGYNSYKRGVHRYVCVYSMFDEYGLENMKIELIEECSCDNLQQLRKREGYYIQHEDCINKRIAGRTQQEYRDTRKDKMKDYLKQYYKDNKEEHSLKSKAYREKNKDKIAEYCKTWRNEHKVEVALKGKEFREQNKDKLRERSKIYRDNNKDAIAERNRFPVVCQHCKLTITRAKLARHQRSKYCMEIQIKNDTSKN